MFNVSSEYTDIENRDSSSSSDSIEFPRVDCLQTTNLSGSIGTI